MKRIRIYFTLLFFLPVSTITGQEFSVSNFVHYTIGDGLSNNTVNGMVQDSTGYMWISTASGLNRYNGSRFIQYHSTNEIHSLASEELFGMNRLDKDRLAIYTSGLHIINTRTNETRNLFIPYKDQQYEYKFNMIERATGDDSGNIFILSRSGFYHFDKNCKLVYRYDHYKDEEVPVKHFFFGRELIKLDSNRLMIVSIAGLYLYDKKKHLFKKMEAADCPIMAEFMIYPVTHYTFLQHKSGHLFIFQPASDTVVYFNINENKKVKSRLSFTPEITAFHYRSRLIQANDSLFYLTNHTAGFYKMQFSPRTGNVNLYPEKYFSQHLCNTLVIDKDKNLWVATNKGVFRQEREKSQVQLTVLPAALLDSFPNIRLDDVKVTSYKVYAGTRGYAGLLLFNKQTLEFEKQITFNNYKSAGNYVYAIASADSSNLLLGTDGPLLLFNQYSRKEKLLTPPNWVTGHWTNDLYNDSKGYIWISSSNIYRFNPVTRQFKIIPTPERLLSIPFSIEEDRDGNMWLSGHGLARYNTKTDSIDLVLDSFPFIKMMDKQVNALVIDQDNTVWFNSNNNGLTAYNVDRKTFHHFTRSDGLPDDNIASLIVIDKKLWIAGYSGMACMDLQNFQIVRFGKEDGFPDMSVLKGARFSYDSISQQLYLGFTNAIVRFNPYALLRKKPSPSLFIENLTINGEKNNYFPGQHITTSWQDNEINITIGSINFYSSNSQRFAYRILKDSNTPWQQLGTQSSFNISHLAPGKYRIQVKSFSINNRWQEQVKEINIDVLPPFWQKPWFSLIMAVLLLVLLYLLVTWRIHVVRKMEMEKTHLQKLKADDYKNQFELEQISNYFSSSLADKKTEDEVLWDVAGNLIGRMNYVDCMIYRWNDDKTKMIQKAAYGPKGKPEYITAQVFDVLPGQGIVGHVMQTKQPILVHDTRIDTRYRIDDEFRLSEICVPIIHNDELLGIIDSEHHMPGYFTDRDIKILTTIATLIGNKIKQIESEQSLEEKGKELAGINEQLVEARLSALQAQMNPHFVFNALNSIKRMILDAENERASRYLSKFALMIRMTLNHSKDHFVTLSENIEYLKAYLEMEQLRSDDSFNWNIHTDENIDLQETAIPSLMIQPLVENAIWHGLMHVEGKKNIKIGFTLVQNKINCSIEDNGIGILKSERMKQNNKTQHRSVGLDNLRNRIKIMNEKYDTDCSLEITDLSLNGGNHSGTLVVLRLNVINL